MLTTLLLWLLYTHRVQLQSLSTAVTSCSQELTVRVTAVDQWQGKIAGSDWFRIIRSDSAKMSPATVTDRAVEWRVWRPPSVYVIAFSVDSPVDRQGFIAAVSYGKQIVPNSYTGTNGTAWKYTTIASFASTGWDTSVTFNDSLWMTADESVRCSTGFPVTSAEGYNFSAFVSNAGQRDVKAGIASPNIQPEQSAYWVAENKRCTPLAPQVAAGRTYYRMVVNATALPPQSCFGRDDYRFNIQANAGGRDIEQWLRPLTANSTSRLQIRAVGREAVTTWFDGRFIPNHVPWQATSYLNFMVDPNKDYLLAFMVKVPQPYSATGFLASATLDDRLIAMTGYGEWKIWPSNSEPSSGWESDINFDESGWQPLDERYICPDNNLGSFWRERTSTNTLCRPDMISFPTCNDADRLLNFYIRLKLSFKGSRTSAHPCFARPDTTANITKQVYSTSVKTVEGFVTVTSNVFLENALSTTTSTSSMVVLESVTVLDTVVENFVESEYTLVTNLVTVQATQTVCKTSEVFIGANNLAAIGGSSGFTIIVGVAVGVFVSMVASLCAVVKMRRQTKKAKERHVNNSTTMSARSVYQGTTMPTSMTRSFSTIGNRSMGNLQMASGIFHTMPAAPTTMTQ
jgi:hypothetical protein